MLVRRAFRHSFTASLFALALCSATSAQTPGDSTRANKPVIRATSRIVYVDVVVRDGSGKIVRGLQQDDFRLTEDKEAQRVSFFEAHNGRPEVPSTAQPGAPVELSNVAGRGRNTSLNMVLLDLVDTTPQDQGYARKRMIQFLRNLPAGEQVALFVLSDKLHMVQGFSTDSSELVKAAQAIDLKQLNRLRPVGQQIRDLDTSAYLDRNATVVGPSSGLVLQSVLGAEDVQNMKERLEQTSVAFSEIARAVNGYPGRKNLFWLAGQFPSAEYNTLGPITATVTPLVGSPGGLREDAAASERRRSQELGIPGVGLGAFEERADKAVADSQIAVYPISLAGVQTDNVGANADGLGTAGSSDAAAAGASAFFYERSTGRSVMENIADRTGGEAFYGSNDPATLLQRGFEDSENYYEVAYQPSNHNWDGKFRTIHVALKSSGLHLSYRKGYFALPEQPAGNALTTFASAMRIETLPSTELVLRATQPTATAGTMHLNVTLDTMGLGFTTDDHGDRRAKLQVMMIAYPVNGDGAIAQSNHMLNMGLTEEDYRMILKSGVPFQQVLPLKPGRYALRIGIVDLGSGRVGTLTVPYTMPAS